MGCLLLLLVVLVGGFSLYEYLFLKRNLWFADRFTGWYPPLRIIWNALTFLPLYLSIMLTTVFVLFHKGIDEAVDFWDVNR